ncbi:nuclear transport factor 2 family protein [Nonomuraea lactucae]|uniref:nuclear transport factor 2 family protein n=1 Tax=Nonomuraea lactucae TaxID=2249762 RepID=UPI000DE1D051|nr:nuclear transport factor 2 family protein [Nonomuraea lactucae]
MDTREIADRLEIANLLARYTHAVDSGTWDLLDEVFTPDAVIDYRAAGGIRGTRAEVKEWLASALAGWPGRLHVIGCTRVDFGHGEAQVSASFTDTLSPSRDMIPAGTKGLIQGGGWYHHRMRRTPDGWRSHELVEEQAWRTAT